MAFFIDGILASEHLDSSGESLSIEGCDLSSIHRGEGVVNFEHESKLPTQVLGRILSAKKIFSEKDIENDRQQYYWNMCKCPYIYILCELFDSDVCKHVAEMFLYSAKNKDKPSVLGWSIEGSKLNKVGPIIKGSIARKATLTATPCNKSCVAEMVPGEEQKSEDSIFKSEPSHTIELLEKSEPFSKAEVPGSKFPAVRSQPGSTTPVKNAPGWSHTGGGNFTHPEHGVVSVVKQGKEFHVKHGGALAGTAGKKGVFGSAKEAGAHAGDYMRSLGQGKTVSPAMHNRPSPSMVGKSEGMAKSLTGRSNGMGKRGMMGGSLPQESTDTKNKRGLFNPDMDKISAKGSMMSGGMGMSRSEPKGNMKKAMTAGSGMAAPGNLVQGAALAPESIDKKMKKTEWLARAEEAYASWEKREQFENFMAKHMPDLTKGEICAIGQALVLRKSLRAEAKLKKMVDEGQDSYVNKKEK